MSVQDNFDKDFPQFTSSSLGHSPNRQPAPANSGLKFSPGLSSPSSHSVPGDLAECHVCDERTQKARIHYGGVSCYSCRAFFRRATTKKKKDVCRRDNMCEVKFDERKRCGACRYTECLRVGMKPHLVLSEDEKQARFKNQKRKSSVGSPSLSDDDSLQVPSIIERAKVSKPSVITGKSPTFRTSPAKSNTSYIVKEEEFPDIIVIPYPRSNGGQQRPTIQYSSRPAQSIGDNDITYNQRSQSPSSAMWMHCRQPPTMIQETYSQNLDHHSQNITIMDQTYPQESRALEIPSFVSMDSQRNMREKEEFMTDYYNNIPVKDYMNELNQNSPPSNLFVKTPIIADTHAPANMIGNRRSVIMRCVTTRKSESESSGQENSDAEQPLDLSLFYKQKQEENTMTKKYLEFGFKPIRITSLKNTVEEPSKTVLSIENKTNTKEFSTDTDENDKMLSDEMILNTLTVIDFREIVNMCTIAEQNYQSNFNDKLNKKWYEINLGQNIMQEYINWLQGGTNLPLKFFHSCSQQVVERSIRMISCTEEFSSLKGQEQLQMLQSNLYLAEALVHVRSANSFSDDDEKGFMMGETDISIWNLFKDKVSSKRLMDMVDNMPFPSPAAKDRFCYLMRGHFPIIRDKNVFNLFLSILLFSPISGKQESKKVTDGRASFTNMLRQYLQKDLDGEVDSKMGEVMEMINMVKEVAVIYRASNMHLSWEGKD